MIYKLLNNKDIKKQTLLLPLFMVFCMQFTYAQTPLSGSQVESYVESHYDSIIYSSIVYGSDDGDDGCWYGSISRSSLPTFQNYPEDNTPYGMLVWVPGPDDCDGYLYDTQTFCACDGNTLGYDGMTIYQISWDEPSPDPEMGEAFFRIGPYFCNSSFLFANRIHLFIYYDDSNMQDVQ